MDKIDPNKKYKTRDGREVARIEPHHMANGFAFEVWLAELPPQGRLPHFYVTEYGKYHTDEDIRNGYPEDDLCDLLPVEEREPHTFFVVTMRDRNEKILHVMFTELAEARAYKQRIDRQHKLDPGHRNYVALYNTEIHEVELEVLS